MVSRGGRKVFAVPISVTALLIAPIKGTRVRAVDSISLERSGVLENRRFYVIDHRDHLVNGKRVGELTALIADYDHEQRRLALTFPDGTVLDGRVSPGAPVQTWFFAEQVPTRLVEGPWSEALSEYSGRPLRLVEAQSSAVDRGLSGAASLISRSSLARLARTGGEQEIDCRRFRMLIEIDGVPAHDEDRWVGRTARVGGAAVRWIGHVGRCLTTSRDPDTGTVDLPTLEMLGSYRGQLDTTEPLPFGIYGEVAEPGPIRVGDPLALLDCD
jgi:uncharacterized protein YcbX